MSALILKRGELRHHPAFELTLSAPSRAHFGCALRRRLPRVPPHHTAPRHVPPQRAKPCAVPCHAMRRAPLAALQSSCLATRRTAPPRRSRAPESSPYSPRASSLDTTTSTTSRAPRATPCRSCSSHSATWPRRRCDHAHATVPPCTRRGRSLTRVCGAVAVSRCALFALLSVPFTRIAQNLPPFPLIPRPRCAVRAWRHTQVFAYMGVDLFATKGAFFDAFVNPNSESPLTFATELATVENVTSA
eukprot:259043-Prymnesium_polylepis.2